MAVPTDPQSHDAQLQDYLLGRLADAEAAPLDELSISDEEFASRLRAAEHDLVDAYVRGELTGKILDDFQTHYLASPRRREKVALARGFSRAVDRVPEGGERHRMPEGALGIPGGFPGLASRFTRGFWSFAEDRAPR